MFFTGGGGQKYYGKPDQQSDDFSHLDLTTGFVERELDLSGIIPAGTIAVQLWLHAVAVEAGKLLYFYPSGYSGVYLSYKAHTIVANQGFMCEFWLPISADRKILYKIDSASWVYIYLNIVGWIK